MSQLEGIFLCWPLPWFATFDPINSLSHTWQTHDTHGAHMSHMRQIHDTHGKHVAHVAHTWQTRGAHMTRMAHMCYVCAMCVVCFTDCFCTADWRLPERSSSASNNRGCRTRGTRATDSLIIMITGPWRKPEALRTESQGISSDLTGAEVKPQEWQWGVAEWQCWRKSSKRAPKERRQHCGGKFSQGRNTCLYNFPDPMKPDQSAS